MPAIVAVQPNHHRLKHRYCEQAHSYSSERLHLIQALAQKLDQRLHRARRLAMLRVDRRQGQRFGL